MHRQKDISIDTYNIITKLYNSPLRLSKPLAVYQEIARQLKINEEIILKTSFGVLEKRAEHIA
jgi:hypothetical protein